MVTGIDQDTAQHFKDRIREEWQNPQIWASYRKWSREESEWGSAARQLIIERARLAPGHTVLDLASGHGEPALQIAEIVSSEGHVTATDLGPGLIEIARERAGRAGLTNITFREVDAHELPFPDGAFDRVTCRLGAMYFADHHTAFREALRVLKPGGRATYLVWGSYDQPIFRDVVGTVLRYAPPSEEEPGGPSPFKFAKPGTLSSALTDAGFTGQEEEQVTVPSPFPGSPERWWEWFVDMAPPFRSSIQSLGESDRKQATDEILGILSKYYDGTTVNLPIDVVVASGSRPS